MLYEIPFNEEKPQFSRGQTRARSGSVIPAEPAKEVKGKDDLVTA